MPARAPQAFQAAGPAAPTSPHSGHGALGPRSITPTAPPNRSMTGCASVPVLRPAPPSPRTIAAMLATPVPHRAAPSPGAGPAPSSPQGVLRMVSPSRRLRSMPSPSPSSPRPTRPLPAPLNSSPCFQPLPSALRAPSPASPGHRMVTPLSPHGASRQAARGTWGPSGALASGRAGSTGPPGASGSQLGAWPGPDLQQDPQQLAQHHAQQQAQQQLQPQTPTSSQTPMWPTPPARHSQPLPRRPTTPPGQAPPPLGGLLSPRDAFRPGEPQLQPQPGSSVVVVPAEVALLSPAPAGCCVKLSPRQSLSPRPSHASAQMQQLGTAPAFTCALPKSQDSVPQMQTWPQLQQLQVQRQQAQPQLQPQSPRQPQSPQAPMLQQPQSPRPSAAGAPQSPRSPCSSRSWWEVMAQSRAQRRDRPGHGRESIGSCEGGPL